MAQVKISGAGLVYGSRHGLGSYLWHCAGLWYVPIAWSYQPLGMWSRPVTRSRSTQSLVLSSRARLRTGAGAHVVQPSRVAPEPTSLMISMPCGALQLAT